MRRKLTVFFDLDGTLYSYETGHGQGLFRAYEYWREITGQSFEEFKRQYDDVKSIIKRYLPDTAASHSRSLYFQTMVEQNFKKTRAKHIAELTQSYWEGFIDSIEPFEGVRDILRELVERGHRLAIITNMSADVQFRKLHALGIDQFFQAVITSEEVGHEKPHPHIYLHALHRMNASSRDAVMIGDSYEHDIEPAEFMGIRSFLINIENNQSREIIERLGSERVITRFEEVLSKIEKIGGGVLESLREGVIKYVLNHSFKPVFSQIQVEDLVRVRDELWRLKLIGVYPLDHPDTPGVGYGNVSKRYTVDGQFIITGSQTGDLPTLSAEHFALVMDYDIDNNKVYSKGLSRPSSEAMTHAAIYEVGLGINWVIHVHNRDLWEKHEELGLLTTPQHATYGTPELARAIQVVFSKYPDTDKPVALLGHEEGLVSWGKTAEEAVNKMVLALKKVVSGQ